MTDPLPPLPPDADPLPGPAGNELSATPEPVAGAGQPAAPEPAPRGAGRRPTAVALAVVAVLAGGALFLSGFALGSLRATTPGTPVDEETAFQPFWDAYRSVTEHYAGPPVDRKQLIDGAIRGMIAALGDPFSAYLSPDEYRQSLQGLSGRFEGIGAQVEARRLTGTGACPTLGNGVASSSSSPSRGHRQKRPDYLPGIGSRRSTGRPWTARPSTRRWRACAARRGRPSSLRSSAGRARRSTSRSSAT